MPMVTARTATATQLNYLVAIAMGWMDVQISAFEDMSVPDHCFFRPSKEYKGQVICGSGLEWEPTTNPAQMYPLVLEFGIGTWEPPEAEPGKWCAAPRTFTACSTEEFEAQLLDMAEPCHGPTPLIAAARCLVEHLLGDGELEVPKELS